MTPVLPLYLQRLNPKAFLPPRPVRVRGEPEEGTEGELTNLEYILRFEIEDPFVEAHKSPFNVRHAFLSLHSLSLGIPVSHSWRFENMQTSGRVPLSCTP
jgi:hypothetical protein